MSASMPWIYSVPVIFTLAFLVAALLYVSLRRGDGSYSKLLAIVGLCTFLTLQISNFVIPIVLARIFTSSDFRIVYALYSCFASLLSITGYSFLIAAIFTGRKSKAAAIPSDIGGPGVSDNNPYSALSR